MSGEPNPPQSDLISFDDFTKIKLRIGRVIEANDHPNADKLIVLKVDLGDEQRQLVAGLKGYYTTDQLVGRNLVVVTNLAPRKMRGVESRGMLLAAVTPDYSQVVVLTTEADIAPGTAVPAGAPKVTRTTIRRRRRTSFVAAFQETGWKTRRASRSEAACPASSMVAVSPGKVALPP